MTSDTIFIVLPLTVSLDDNVILTRTDGTNQQLILGTQIVGVNKFRNHFRYEIFIIAK